MWIAPLQTKIEDLSLLILAQKPSTEKEAQKPFTHKKFISKEYAPALHNNFRVYGLKDFDFTTAHVSPSILTRNEKTGAFSAWSETF